MHLPILFNAESLIQIFSLELCVNILVFTFSCEVKVFVWRLFIRSHWPLYRRKTEHNMEWPCPSVCPSAPTIVCELDILKTAYLIDFVF